MDDYETFKEQVLQQLESEEERACDHLRESWTRIDLTGIETVRGMFSKYEEQEGKLLREELVRLQVDIIELPLLNESFESSQQSGEETVRDDNAAGGSPLTQNTVITPDSLQSKTSITHDDIYNAENIVLLDQKLLHDNDYLRHQVRELEEEVERLNIELQNQESQKKKFEVTLETEKTKLKKSSELLQHTAGRLHVSESLLQVLKQQNSELSEANSLLEERMEQLTNQLESKNIKQSTAMRASWIIEREAVESTNEFLGRGAWGIVHKALYYGAPVAVKCLHNLPPENRALFVREMEIASHCHHPNVLRFIGATHDNDHPWLVTELMDRSLRCLIKQLKKDGDKLREQDILTLIKDIANGLRYLHAGKTPPIVHRDIKSDNILLKRKGDFWQAKISDYGTANVCSDAMTPNRGTLVYAAPESITSNQQSPKMDVYSFGLVVLEMCIGDRPTPGSFDQQLQRVTSASLGELIFACIQVNPRKRPTMKEVIDFLKKCPR